VTAFQPAGDGDTVYYLATPDTFEHQRLFRLSLATQASELLLDSTPLQNFRLKVSPDGQMVVERLNPQTLKAGTQLWVKFPERDDFQPVPIPGQASGDFAIAPDNASLIVAQGQGLAVVRLQENASLPDFLPQYGQVLAIKPDGTAVAVLRFNSNYTRTLVILTNAGQRHELLTTNGSVHAGSFAPVGTTFYAAVGRLSAEAYPEYREVPELMAFDWKIGQSTSLVRLDRPASLEFSVAPDGRSILYGAKAIGVEPTATQTDPSGLREITLGARFQAAKDAKVPGIAGASAIWIQ
jgi:Tol biopolymer transport system component